MVALQQSEDYGTSQFVFEQIQQRGPQRRPAIYTTLRIVIDANEGTITRHMKASDGELRYQRLLADCFDNPAAAISFYTPLGFRVDKKHSKGGRVVLEAKATYTQARTFDGREPDFTPLVLPQKRIVRANAPVSQGCKIEGCTEPRETQTGRRLCATHRRETDKANKRKSAAKKRGVVQS